MPGGGLAGGRSLAAPMPLGISTSTFRAAVVSSSSCTAVLSAWRRFEISCISSAASAPRITSGNMSPLRNDPAAPPTMLVATSAPPAPPEAAGGGDGGDGSAAGPPAPGSRLRTPTATRIIGQKPSRCVWYTEPENTAMADSCVPTPYSRSNSVPARSTMIPSAAAVPGRSSIPVNMFSHMSTGAVSRVPIPIAMSSLIADAISKPPVHVSVKAPPSRMLSSPLNGLLFQPAAVTDIRPCTVVSERTAASVEPRPVRSSSSPSTSTVSSADTPSTKRSILPVRR